MHPKVSVCLLTCLLVASCASVAPGPQRVLPPSDLTAACPEPAGAIGTNAGLAEYTRGLIDALRGCNRQLEALRQWAQD